MAIGNEINIYFLFDSKIALSLCPKNKWTGKEEATVESRLSRSHIQRSLYTILFFVWFCCVMNVSLTSSVLCHQKKGRELVILMSLTLGSDCTHTEQQQLMAAVISDKGEGE
jgi:hypothetical protein